MGRLLEVCCSNLESVRAATSAEAQRLELCRDLSCGGLSPEIETIREATRLCGSSTGLQVLFRPRPGDFVYTRDEIERTCSQIEQFSRFCARFPSKGHFGIVIGALTPERNIDVEACKRMIDSAHRIKNITFHRAFDECQEPFRALEDIISLGCNRLLTSGQAPSAPGGSSLIARLVEEAHGRISIMAGAGVNSGNVLALVKKTGVSEVHGSCRDAKSGDCSSKEEIKKIRKILQNV